MFCCKCGTNLTDDSRFCNKCGAEISKSVPSAVNPQTSANNNQAQGKTIQMVCQECGGVMNMDSERTVLMCPYCDSKKLIVENDEVKIARIKAATDKDIAEMVLDSSQRSEESDKRVGMVALGLLVFMVIASVAVAVAANLLGW